MSIQMKMSEVVDRWTILRMKVRLTKDVAEELRELDFEIMKFLVSKEFTDYPFECLRAISQIMEANAKIWVLEASIRKEFEGDDLSTEKLALEDIGRRALAIRNVNRIRIQGKTELDTILNNNPDVKVDHASTLDVRIQEKTELDRVGHPLDTIFNNDPSTLDGR